jgi:DNA primase
MADSPIELIKEKIDIVDFLSGYLQLTRAGKNYKALCPFHKEKTPSFMVSPERQSWHCFGCGLGGDIFTFLMKYENLEFGEALKVLAEKAGVELKKISPQEYKYVGLLYELNEIAKNFFIEQLENNKEAEAYLKSRGLNKETIAEFEIGASPFGYDELAVHLINLGYDREDILRSGLVFINEKGKIMDRFRQRIMFPIHNHLGKIVGFTGRILPQFETDEIGKYVNSPETSIFKKSKILYGFWKSKNFIREADAAFLVEGQMDFLMSWQSGIKNVLATSGTSLTIEHLSAIKKITENLIISFDNDSAGWEAGERAIDLANSLDFSTKVVILEDAKDPAELAYKNPEKLKEIIKNPIPSIEFYFKKYLKADLTPTDRNYLKNLRIMLLKILNLSSPVERNFWIKQLAQKTQTSESSLIEEIQKLNNKFKNNLKKESENLAAKKFNRLEILSQEFIRALIAYDLLNQDIKELEYLDDQYKKIFNLIKDKKYKTNENSVDELINLILLGVKEKEFYNLDELKKHLKNEFIKQRKNEIIKQIKEAEIKGDENKLKDALTELHNLINLE